MAKEKPLRIEIDPLALDEEWVGQAPEFHHWSVVVADAQNELDEAESSLDLVRAELDRDIRATPAGYGVAKVTEEVIKQTIVAQDVYQAAVKTVNKARHACHIAKAAVAALEHRKRALTLLVKLWIRDYYSEPKTPGSEELKDFDKAAVRKRGRMRREKDAEIERHEERDTD